MAWPHYAEVVTVADVLDAGACLGGVKKWVAKNGGIIAGNTAKYLGNDRIARAAIANGNGNGNGYGNGYGDGDDGNGYGNGYGDGYGNGYGDGDGGYGNGYGDGYGNGYGDGDDGNGE